MNYIDNPDHSFTVESSELGKIGGTTFAALCGQSDFCSPFQAQCEMLGLYHEPSNSAMELGHVLESKIIERYENESGSKVEVFAPIGDDYRNWEYHFVKGIFGAHVDGLADDRKTAIEVKTSSNPKKWMTEKGITVPPGYYLQASLYAWIVEAEKIKFLVGFVQPPAYQNPSENTDFEMMVIDVEPMHIANPETFMEMIEFAKETYRNLESTHRTCPPDLDNTKDRQVIRTILDSSHDNDAIGELLSELEKVKAEADELNDRADELVSKIKTLLALNTEDGGKCKVVSSNGTNWTYRRDIACTTNYKQACIDNNVDVENYKKQSIKEVLSQEKKKEE